MYKYTESYAAILIPVRVWTSMTSFIFEIVGREALCLN